MQHEQIPARRLQAALLQTFFEEVCGRGQVGKEGAPGADLCFAGALNDDVEVLGEGGEEGEDGGEKGLFGRRLRVDFFVEDFVEEDFEGVGEVEEVLVVVAEVEGGGVVVLGEVVAQEWREEEMCLRFAVSVVVLLRGLG
jgi:hypothetical protein